VRKEREGKVEEGGKSAQRDKPLDGSRVKAPSFDIIKRVCKPEQCCSLHCANCIHKPQAYRPALRVRNAS